MFDFVYRETILNLSKQSSLIGVLERDTFSQSHSRPRMLLKVSLYLSTLGLVTFHGEQLSTMSSLNHDLRQVRTRSASH